TAAVGAMFDVDVEDSFEQSRPAHARWFSLSLVVIGQGLSSALCGGGNDLTAQLRVGCQYAVEADQMKTRTRHQGGQALHELQRLRLRGNLCRQSALRNEYVSHRRGANGRCSASPYRSLVIA